MVLANNAKSHANTLRVRRALTAMNDYEAIEREVKELSTKAKSLLDELASCNKLPTEEQIIDLDWFASKISKLSYGNNRPEFISSEMYNLISWCDHNNEPEIKSKFITALRNRPLKVPSWSS
tara:strand:- start:10938 stop:11303 length:366 start_codon:yes stop_codon:yes gene_type:complete